MDPTQDVLDALILAVKGHVEDNRLALLFSGGLDSSVLAAVAAEFGNPTLYTVGVEGSHDLSVAEDTAASLDMPWVGLVMDETEIMSSIVLVSRLISTSNPISISFEIPLLRVSENAGEGLLMSGQGADELFGGYARYLKMSVSELKEGMNRDLRSLLEDGARNERHIAEYYDKRICHPFLHPRVIDAACAIPVDEHVRNGVRKAVLRDVALYLNLGEIAAREKKAAQYGSGIMKAMKAAARRERMTLATFIEDLVRRRESP